MWAKPLVFKEKCPIVAHPDT